MKNITLSLLSASILGSMAYADTMTLYTDPSTGQVYTQGGEGRKAMGEFVSADELLLKDQPKESKKGDTSIFSKASKIKFSGQHYLGFVSKNTKDEDTTNSFEMRRNYIQVKAYLFDDPKSYMRVTLDETTGNGDNTIRIKYAYLYLNEILPYTGLEVGQAHRPWLDYEEHQGWWHRAVDKTFTESKESADLTNSADMGINFKTKTPYFTSELGIFNGEGYHSSDDGQGLSAEWRLTAAILGNGDKKRKAQKSTYWDASFWGQYNMKNAKNINAEGDGENYTILGFHTVYNMPQFLIALQYNIATNDNETGEEKYRLHHNGQGYSANIDYRFGSELEFDLFARYDYWMAKDTTGDEDEYEMTQMLYGVAWEQNSNLTWYLNGKTYTPKDDKNYEGKSVADATSIMITAEINW
jgi:hypothetical protein